MARKPSQTSTRTWRVAPYHRQLCAAAAIGMLALAVVAVSGCTARPQDASQPAAPAETPATAPEAAAPAPAEPTGQLEAKDLVVGKGEAAKRGDQLTVHYTGWLMDGTKFDSSLDSGQPFQFVLGQGRVIEGWDVGLEGMKVGGKRQLIIPPQMAYGEQGAGSAIPPNATLKFEVELLAVQPATQ